MAQMHHVSVLIGEIGAGRNHSRERQTIDIHVIEGPIVDCSAAQAKFLAELFLKSLHDSAKIIHFVQGKSLEAFQDHFYSAFYNIELS